MATIRVRLITGDWQRLAPNDYANEDVLKAFAEGHKPFHRQWLDSEGGLVNREHVVQVRIEPDGPPLVA